MNSKNNRDQIWVCPHNDGQQEGSYELPFSSLSEAIERAHPGQTVILKAGVYKGDVTIQNSGDIDKPLRIMAQEGAIVRCVEACWYFYDVSDVICSGIVFHHSPNMAMAVMGKCERNRFERMKFIDCSLTKENACTMFFGGSGQACNVVESCEFIGNAKNAIFPDGKKATSVGIMIAEGDFHGGEPNRDHIIGKNSFSHYGYGVLLGSQDGTLGEYGHRITYNSVENCGEGIMVKCGDTLVKGNIIRHCLRSISLAAGIGSIVEDNRIIDCDQGIRIAGKGHTVFNNCIVRCKKGAIRVIASIPPQTPAAANIVIEKNTMVDWGQDPASENSGITIEPGTTCVVHKNLFHGKGNPYAIIDLDNSPHTQERKRYLIDDNAVTKACELPAGVLRAMVTFIAESLDNYANDSAYGARGWMLSPEAYDPGPPTEIVCIPEPGIEEPQAQEPDVEDIEDAQDFDGSMEGDDAAVWSMFVQDDDASYS